MTVASHEISASPWRYRHAIRVRYGEVDQQGVVFNAHYLAYVDDTVEHWLLGLRERLRSSDDPERERWDFMLKRATIEWSGSLGNGDVLYVDAAPVRWGGASFELHYRGTSEDRRIFDARVLYVTVEKGANRPYATPQVVRDYLGPAVEVPD